MDDNNSSFKEKCNYHFSNILDILGDKATIELSDKSIITINCVFENFHHLIDEDAFSEVGIETNKPRLVCKEADVKNVKINDKVFVDNRKYKVVELQPEGTGTINLILNKL